jgi:hypothetical protein
MLCLGGFGRTSRTTLAIRTLAPGKRVRQASTCSCSGAGTRPRVHLLLSMKIRMLVINIPLLVATIRLHLGPYCIYPILLGSLTNDSVLILTTKLHDCTHNCICNPQPKAVRSLQKPQQPDS